MEGKRPLETNTVSLGHFKNLVEEAPAPLPGSGVRPDQVFVIAKAFEKLAAAFHTRPADNPSGAQDTSASVVLGLRMKMDFLKKRELAQAERVDHA